MGAKQTNPNTNKDIKAYKSFLALNDRIKNMSKLLPLIGQLHSKYMQDRHWKRLMATTCKKIDHKNPRFCLNDLLVLELHKYEADVEESGPDMNHGKDGSWSDSESGFLHPPIKSKLKGLLGMFL